MIDDPKERLRQIIKGNPGVRVLNLDLEDFFSGTGGKKPGNISSTEPNRDIIAEGLLSTFVSGVEDQDKEFLEDAVVQLAGEVYQRTSNDPLQYAHARAALFIDNFEICYESLTKIRNPTSNLEQAMGLVAHAQQNYETANTHFERAGSTLTTTSRIVYALSLLGTEQRDLEIYQEILEPIAEKNSVANTILGYVAFNGDHKADAEKYLGRAAELNPNSERVQLNHLRGIFLNSDGENIVKIFNFYRKTGSKLQVDQMKAQLEVRELAAPNFVFDNPFQVVSSLMGYKS